MRLRAPAIAATILFLVGPPLGAQTFPEGQAASPSTAALLSFAGTVVPIAAGIPTVSGGDAWAYVPGLTAAGLGLVAGPSTGHFYAGLWGRGLRSSALRLAAGGVVGGALACASGCESGVVGYTVVAAGGAAAVYVVYSVFRDLTQVDDDVRRAVESGRDGSSGSREAPGGGWASGLRVHPRVGGGVVVVFSHPGS